jgi:hypothetical protein
MGHLCDRYPLNFHPLLGFVDDVEPTDGFVTFSLTNGPEYHVSQVARLTFLIN